MPSKPKWAAREWIERYGARWPEATDLEIEMDCIQRGGTWKAYPSHKDSPLCGAGLEHHYEQMRRILWPELDDHRWHRICRDNIIQNKVCVLMGPGSSAKTHSAAWLGLCEYYCFPNDLCLLISSTDMRGLRLRVWAEITMLHERAKARFPELAGNLIDSKLAICTDALQEDKVRDLRKGIIGIPCVQNGKWVGLGKYSGIKQKHMRLIADEAQFMGASFLNSFANLDKNEDFKAVVLGNPNDVLDPLGKAAEPLDGWSAHLEPEKTSVWKTRFMNGVCVNLIGTDSPNFDFPESEPTHYKYLISREKIANTLSFFPRDSVEYYSQCVGAMKIGVMARRVMTRDLVLKFGARDKVIWGGGALRRIFALDSAYGGDRCVGGHIDFGLTVDGVQAIKVNQPQIVPILAKSDLTPEDQISEWVKEYCETWEIDPADVFHDSTGRGGLGTSLARIFSALCNPVEFGGPATPRPVSLDLYIYDMKTKARRLKRCDEHYDRFVTELWWSIRLCVESRQLFELSEDVMEELCMREWDKIKENKIKIETKKEMKLRVGRSPDLADWLAIGVEGARRRGFQIAKLANTEEETWDRWQWLRDLQRTAQEAIQRHQLTRV